jgi:hydrogenase maturation protease
MKIAVIGIGQSMRGDDAAGLEAVRRWQKQFPETSQRPELHVELSESPGLALLDELDGCDAGVLVDAVQSFVGPGTLHRLDPEQLSAFGPDAKSAHGWGVAETLQLDRQLNPARQRIPIRVIGIEAGQLGVGTGLSREVKEALPRACEAIQHEVEELLTV